MFHWDMQKTSDTCTVMDIEVLSGKRFKSCKREDEVFACRGNCNDQNREYTYVYAIFS